MSTLFRCIEAQPRLLTQLCVKVASSGNMALGLSCFTEDDIPCLPLNDLPCILGVKLYLAEKVPNECLFVDNKEWF